MKKTFLLFAIAAVSSQFSVSAQDVSSWYSFNKDFKDSLNVANEGVVTGDVTLAFDADRNSTVAVFNESINDGGYVTLPAEILNTETLTVSCWAMHNNPNIGTWGRFWDFGTSNENYILLSYSQDNGMKPTVDITVAKAAGARVQSPDPILTGVWHHYVVTYGDGFSRLYMDGVEVNSAENTSSLLAIFNSGTCTNYLGKSHWPDAALVGRIDDLRTFNKVLSADDVTKLFDGTFATGMKKENADVASKVYAANGSIKVDLAAAGKGSIAVYDVAGKKVFGTSSLSASNSIAVKGQGIYIVKLINGGNVTTSKVSVTK